MPWLTALMIIGSVAFMFNGGHIIFHLNKLCLTGHKALIRSEGLYLYSHRSKIFYQVAQVLRAAHLATWKIPGARRLYWHVLFTETFNTSPAPKHLSSQKAMKDDLEKLKTRVISAQARFCLTTGAVDLMVYAEAKYVTAMMEYQRRLIIAHMAGFDVAEIETSFYPIQNLSCTIPQAGPPRTRLSHL